MWKSILKKTVTKQKVIDFMIPLLQDALSKIKAKEGITEVWDLTDGRGGSSMEGYYYSPNYVLEFFPLVGYHEDGFKPEEFDRMETGVDWYKLWNNGFGDVINDIADKFGEEFRLKEEDKDAYPIINYMAGAYNFENATFMLHCKNDDAWAESLIRDIHDKIVEEYGKPDGKDRYEPEFPMAYDANTGKNTTADEALSQDKVLQDREDWRNSVKGKE